MNDVVETFPYEEALFKELQKTQQSKGFVGIGLNNIGTIIGVAKKDEETDSPFIEVIYQINM